MAIDFINVNPNAVGATQAQLLIAYKNTLRTAYNLGKQVLGIMGHANNGTDFTTIETLFGLAAGKGQTVFNFINGSVGSMEGTFQVADAKTITESVG